MFLAESLSLVLLVPLRVDEIDDCGYCMWTPPKEVSGWIMRASEHTFLNFCYPLGLLSSKRPVAQFLPATYL